MSKTFDKNSIAVRIQVYWKRFGVSGIGFTRKYRLDPFFRTEVNIILLQTMFVFLVLALVAAAVFFVYTNKHDIIGIGIAVIAVTAGFGYLVARLTLAPTRTALVTQKRFVSNIAHEIRTPLSILKTNNEVTLLEPNLDPRTRKMLRSNIEETDRIAHTINNFLSMSSFQKPEKIEFIAIDLGKVLGHVLQILTPFAEHKNISIVVKKSEYRVVIGNADALDQILANILKNAITFTKPGGSILVTIEPDYHGSINFTVEDTGVGISQKDLQSIFEPFYRADYSRNRAFGGSGLGLSIVKELVRLHRGKISIRSTSGKGTTVLVSFPCGTYTHYTEDVDRTADISGIVADFTRPHALE
ncbi:MAG: sensor histidine kinase [Minisyncoccota bacterium]